VTHANSRTLAVIGRGTVQDPEAVRAQLKQRADLLPGDRVRVEKARVAFTLGSPVFHVGRRWYVAPAPLDAVPEDVAELVRLSRAVLGTEERP